MSLTKITSKVLHNTAIAGSLGYTPANKAGDTFTGKVNINDGTSSYTSGDANGYPRFTGTYSSAQIGLFRGGDSVGGMYLGADSSQFSVWDSSFNRRLNVTQGGIVTMPNQPKWLYTGGTSIASGWTTMKPSSAVITSANYSTSTGRFTAPEGGGGTYYVGIWGLLYPADSTDTWTAQFVRNGSTYGTNMGIQGGGNSTNHTNYSASTIVYLAAGDYIEFQLITGNNGVNAYSTQWSQYGFLMG